MHIPTRLIAVWLMMFLSIPAVAAPPDWPQWRGPTRDGVVPGEGWPDSLDEQHLTRVWRVDLAEGYPGPIVSGGKVLTVETREKQDEIVRAFDLETGEAVWSKQWAGAMKVPFFAKRNGSWVRCTPATDGQHLYVGGMRDVLVCLKNDDGEEVWRVDFTERYGTDLPSFGYVSSPLIDGDTIYVQAGMSVIKINKKTGEEIWRTLADDRAMWGSAFSSPVIAEIGGVRQLIVQARMLIAGVDLETGDVLWQQPVKSFRGMNILTPIVHGDDQLLIASYGGGTRMIEVKQADEKWGVSKLWALPMEGYMANPAVIDGHAYLHRRNKKVSCIDLSTGEEKWTKGGGFGEYWSFTQQGDRILALDQDGTLRLIKANPEKYELLSERRVADAETWAHLAVVGDKLIVRELKGLSVWEWNKK